MPISSSTLQGEFTFPDIQNIFVPVFLVYQLKKPFAPSSKIVGTTAMVSTLFTIVGHPYRPTNAGKRF